MFVSNYMSRPVVSVRPETPLTEVRELLQSRSFRHLPVVNEEEVLVGIVTERDLRSALPSAFMSEEEKKEYLARFAASTVTAIMTEAVYFLDQRATLDDALLLFDRSRVGALPVVDESKRLLGILSIRDLLAAYRNLFGLGEKGSRLVAVLDDGQPKILTRLTEVLEHHEIPFTRLVKCREQEEEGSPGRIYIRVHTYNSSVIHRVLEEAGFAMVVP
jgi:acetoin utilization protein AcuB